ncbi:hypothetical protein QQS21_000107 [Conoideocrella luteorostrata]|uniref:Glucose oxidase n=1 Tax=Conoideocrella luteorostrata TaxID=1105319 RepID=A0AAJ0G317_9HYPO|nr:hypothetical protein QQS21_000107 [Conoideocrella luteorostrata]
MLLAQYCSTAVALAGLVCATVVTDDAAQVSNKTFDFVIVGAGLAGITLSGRGHSVLIIEAGPDGSWNPAVFNAEGQSFPPTYCNWNYPIYGNDGQKLNATIDAGACIGGSTSINGMVWYRPTRAEIDQLESLGNPGWNWNTLEPYMEAIERNIPPTEEQIAQGAGYEPSVHGYHGLVNTSFPTPMRIPKAVKLYKETLPRAFSGLTIGNDLSNRSSIASASTSWTIWYDPVSGKMKRSSAADALLWAPTQQRPSLTVLANHTVGSVLFDGHVKARCVSFSSTLSRNSETKFVVNAAKSVILAAGTLATAPILERSGVGKASVLSAAKVKQLVDLPGVGANLLDQPGVSSSALIRKEYQNDTSLIDGRRLFAPEISLVNIGNIWAAGSTTVAESLTSPATLSSRAKSLVDAGAAVNVEGAEMILNATIRLIVQSKLPVAEVIAESYPTIFNAVFWPLMPLSRGHVHISSSSPFEFPVITPRFVTDAFDQQIGITVVRRIRDLWNSAPLADYIADPYYDPKIGPNGTDADYLAWFQKSTSGASHWIGATAMLPRHLGGVVDSRLRVYGTKNLRVVDAGILPFQITSHTMSTLYAVAQRAAELILEDCK